MINVEKAQMYCAQPIELIENYEKAVNDTTQVWHCHHVWETMLGYSKDELIAMNEYYGIPACNLIFLTSSEHTILHKKGKHIPEKTRIKISESQKGKYVSEESRKKMSESHKGKKLSDETLKKLSDIRKGHITTDETKKKISKSNSGRKRTKEQCKRISDSLIGKFNNKNTSKPILQFTLDGEFIAEYPSINEAKRQLCLNNSHICGVLKGERKSAGGFIWKYNK